MTYEILICPGCGENTEWSHYGYDSYKHAGGLDDSGFECPKIVREKMNKKPNTCKCGKLLSIEGGEIPPIIYAVGHNDGTPTTEACMPAPPPNTCPGCGEEECKFPLRYSTGSRSCVQHLQAVPHYLCGTPVGADKCVEQIKKSEALYNIDKKKIEDIEDQFQPLQTPEESLLQPSPYPYVESTVSDGANLEELGGIVCPFGDERELARLQYNYNSGMVIHHREIRWLLSTIRTHQADIKEACQIAERNYQLKNIHVLTAAASAKLLEMWLKNAEKERDELRDQNKKLAEDLRYPKPYSYNGDADGNRWHACTLCEGEFEELWRQYNELQADIGVLVEGGNVMQNEIYDSQEVEAPPERGPAYKWNDLVSNLPETARKHREYVEGLEEKAALARVALTESKQLKAENTRLREIVQSAYDILKVRSYGSLWSGWMKDANAALQGKDSK